MVPFGISATVTSLPVPGAVRWFAHCTSVCPRRDTLLTIPPREISKSARESHTSRLRQVYGGDISRCGVIATVETLHATSTQRARGPHHPDNTLARLRSGVPQGLFLTTFHPRG